jgi:hypothetical protein
LFSSGITKSISYVIVAILALKTPGPANYLIESKIPSGPQFSMVGKGEFSVEDESAPPINTEDDDVISKPIDKSELPGPASYAPNTQVMLNSPPAFSLGAPWVKLKPNTTSPGPAYCHSSGTVAKNDAPKVALKGRYSEQPSTYLSTSLDF